VGSDKTATWKRWVQAPIFIALWACALFVSAGQLHWVRGWIYMGLYVVGMSIAAVVIWRFNPSLIGARANWRHSDTKPFDKVFLALFLPVLVGQLVVAGLDAARYRWSSLPAACLYTGSMLFVGAVSLMAWTLVVNPYAESTVRIQTDRGHRVITSGPYRFVRHPMYTGALFMYVATPLVLGSLWALAFTGVLIVLFVWRTVLEDRTLRNELPGYQEYAARTRYRLLPKVW
jgi:protein-S-isoprenylcysteine O-methyltransferase Ste14